MLGADMALAETIDGFTYTLDTSTSTATVTGTPSGNVVIPPTINYNNCTYNVTAISGVSYSGLISIEIPSTVKRIEKGSFRNRESLIQVTLSEGLSYIGNFAFEGCDALTNITIPTTVSHIGEGAFRDCSSLTKIVWNAKNCADFTSASDAPFNYRPFGYVYQDEENYKNDYTTSIIFGDEVEYIPAYLCYNFIALTTLVIPQNVKEIGAYAFHGFYYDNSLNKRYDSNLTSVTFGSKLESIGSYAFFGRRSIVEISIPNNCATIGSNAFGECNKISSITLGKNISVMGTNAFTSSSINTINIYAITPPVITRSVFLNVNYFNLITLNVPSKAFDTYKTATVWKDMSVHAMSSDQQIFTLSVSSADESMGTTSPGGMFDEDSEVLIYASAKDGYKFSKWNDGNTDNPRTVTMIGDLSFVAYFETVIPDNPNPGDDNPDDPEPVNNPDTDISSMNNVIYLNKVEASADSQINLSIRMKNSAAIRGFQFDLYLPEGVTVVKSAKGKIIGSLSEGRLGEDDEHSLTLSEQGDGAIRFLCGSLYDETFTGNDGEIATLTVKIAEDMSDGDYPIILRNMKLTETDINNYYQTDYVKSTLTITSYTLGDINSDQKIDVSDYIGIANHILGNTPDGFVVKAADVNLDGNIDVSDYIGVANIILTGSIYGGTSNAPVVYFLDEENQEVDPD